MERGSHGCRRHRGRSGVSDFTRDEVRSLKAVAKEHDSASGCVTFFVAVIVLWLAVFFCLPTALGRACQFPDRTRWQLAWDSTAGGRECVLTTPNGWVPR